MAIFYVVVDVKYRRHLDLLGKRRVRKKKVKGFIQEFGVTAQDVGTAESLIREFIARADPAQSDNIDITFDEFSTLTLAEVQRNFLEDPEMGDALVGHPADAGIWYRTGRAFYGR